MLVVHLGKLVGMVLCHACQTVSPILILIGYPIALVYLGAGPRWQRVILFVVILPLLTSVVVRTFAWIVILGREMFNPNLIMLGICIIGVTGYAVDALLLFVQRKILWWKPAE